MIDPSLEFRDEERDVFPANHVIDVFDRIGLGRSRFRNCPELQHQLRFGSAERSNERVALHVRMFPGRRP
jgi:hypothetical protein